MSADYAGVPPPASSLGAFLLKQVQELVDAVRGLVNKEDERDRKMRELIELTGSMKAESERISTIQDAQGIELIEMRSKLNLAQKQLNGLKISRGKHKAKVQRILDQMEVRLN